MRLLLYALVLTIVGCASPAVQQQMVASPVDSGVSVNRALFGSLAVRNVSGGSDTNPLWVSQVGPNEFRGALTESLRGYGYLVSTDAKPRFFIDANLDSLIQPFMGLTFNVTSVVTYRVEQDGVKRTIPVTATGSATPSDAFIGVERMRLANERSIKENIRAFLSRISSELK
jgi:hypothetical protein